MLTMKNTATLEILEVMKIKFNVEEFFSSRKSA
jgi:hypothetical protein